MRIYIYIYILCQDIKKGDSLSKSNHRKQINKPRNVWHVNFFYVVGILYDLSRIAKIFYLKPNR